MKRITIVTSSGGIGRTAIFILAVFMNLYTQQQPSVSLDKNFLVMRAEGISFLGSGMNEADAKVFAVNDAKRAAVEQAGTYLESHSGVLNDRLVKDEIIAFSAGLVKVEVLNAGPKLINDRVAFKVDIEARIDLKSLDERIQKIRKDSKLRQHLEAGRERNKRLDSKIADLRTAGDMASRQEIQNVINELTATEWLEKGQNTDDEILRVDCFSRAVELDPQYGEAYLLRAFAYENLKKWGPAVQDWTKLLELDENKGMLLSCRAGCYFALEQYEEAISDYNQAIKLNPQSAYSDYVSRGNVYRRLKKYETAVQDYENAVELEPQSSSAYYGRGLVYQDLEKYKSAVQDFTKAIEFEGMEMDTLEPDDFSYGFRRGLYKILSEYHYQRGYSLFLAGQYMAAISDFNQIIELLPNYSDRDAGYFDKPDREVHTYIRRGLAYAQLKENQTAIQDFNKAIQLNPQADNAYFGRGIVYRNIGENDFANQDLNTYLKMIGNKYGNAEKVRKWIREMGYTPQY